MYFWSHKQILSLLYEISLLLLWTSLSVQAEFFSLQISVKLFSRSLTQVDWRSYSRELDKSCSVNLTISQDLNIQLHYYISVLNLSECTFKKINLLEFVQQTECTFRSGFQQYPVGGTSVKEICTVLFLSEFFYLWFISRIAIHIYSRSLKCSLSFMHIYFKFLS